MNRDLGTEQEMIILFLNAMGFLRFTRLRSQPASRSEGYGIQGRRPPGTACDLTVHWGRTAQEEKERGAQQLKMERRQKNEKRNVSKTIEEND
ncbi:hypothetical protein EYF80_043498 [Liparis tanakae]|uniref:Uncharacterized protein n=1 Tax=Liparis tanakae TaxID=230148 RepID=A0A4Z2FZJ3_9TELE|nr:hypothetical protein EYF80_043498 [Liparis tanakae]